MTTKPPLRRLLSCLLLASASALQATEPVVAPGQLVEGLTATEDERYAVFLPSSYGPEISWPVLIVMDPRGRAAVAAGIFRDAAERFGYVLLSSENTRSDLAPSAVNPNETALRTLLEVALSSYGTDPARVYLAGFSGTSRFAWTAGIAFPDRIAGVIGVGGGLPGPWREWNEAGFSYFGAAGQHDFNHREMRELDEALDGVLPHRFRYFPGVHQWLRPEDATDALAWMELQAMHRGLAPGNPALVEQLFGERLEAANRAEQTGAAFDAFEALLATAEDFTGLVSDTKLAPVRDRASRLAQDERVTRTNKQIRGALERERSYRERVGSAVRLIAYNATPPTAARLLRDLEIVDLQRDARGDSHAADSARRQLELAFVHTAFYTPRALLAKNAPRRAALSLEIATSIFPDRPQAWVNLAEARARAGQRKAAVKALTEALGLGYSDGAYLRSQEWFTELRGNDAFKALFADAGDGPGEAD